jgi:hypothetical protein
VLLRTTLPEEHRSTDTKDVVMLGVALIATMAALVLGLLIASAKTTYDTRSNQLLQVSADIILLDRALAHYGKENEWCAGYAPTLSCRRDGAVLACQPEPARDDRSKSVVG